MISDEILPRASQVERIPVFELIAEFLERLLGDGATLSWVSTLLEDVIPNLIGEILCLEANGGALSTVEVVATSLKEMGYCVVSHVDCRV
jgi:hypothetical protein